MKYRPFTFAGALLLLATTVAVGSTVVEDGLATSRSRCATNDPSEEEIQHEIELTSQWLRKNGGSVSKSATVTIPVAMHIIRSDTGEWDVTQQQIDDQIAVLNAAYATTSFQFTLVSVDRTDNTNWATDDSFEVAMKTALAVDPATTLNLYTTNPDGYAGYADYPFAFPESDIRHGVVCSYATLPGGFPAPFDEGDTATHEVGHYLGLYHTFMFGCLGNGDLVDDTPAEATPAYGCPIGRDTCPSPGLDPVTNFMNYSTDPCQVEFTPGQSRRMDMVVAAFKPTLFSACSPDPIAEFVGTPLSGSTPQPAVFTDLSTGDPEAWFWTFGDGANSTMQNPTHVYASPGQYDVSLTVSNLCGNDAQTKVGYIVVGDPTVDVVVSTATAGPLGIYMTPGGTGDELSAAQQWDGVPGSTPAQVNGTITVTLTSGGSPVAGHPASLITLDSSAGGWSLCTNQADGPTDATGTTTFSGALTGGGFSAPAELLQVSVDGFSAATTTYPGGLTGLEIQINSSDINGDHDVNLIDVGLFAEDFGSGSYRSDFSWNETVNLVDLGSLASDFGTTCGAAKVDGVASSAAVGVYFDREGRVQLQSLAAGSETTAYILLTGESAERGITAWQAVLNSSPNLDILEITLPDGSVSVGHGMKIAVGTGGVARAQRHRPLILASVRVRATDEAPARLGLDSGNSALATYENTMRVSETQDARLNDTNNEDRNISLAPRLRNHPNPFNPSTQIRFNLNREARTEVRIYDVGGRLVSSLGGAVMPAGANAVDWHGTDHNGDRVVSGLYFCRLFVDGKATGSVQKMSLVK